MYSVISGVAAQEFIKVIGCKNYFIFKNIENSEPAINWFVYDS